MRELSLRILRRAVFVAIVLGIMGYGFAELYLAIQIANRAPLDPANNSLKWNVPLRFVLIGVSLYVILELIIQFIRRKSAASPAPNKPPADPVAIPKKPETLE